MRPIALLATLALLGLVGCGGDDVATEMSETAEPTAATAATAEAAKPAEPKPTGIKLKTGDTRFGKIIQNSDGRTIYLFTREKSDKPRCFGDCAVAWPPVYTKGTPRASGGLKQSKMGTAKYRGRTIATYNGHPLYYYVDEDEPGEVLCQAVYEFGGYWYVIDRKGDAIT